MQYLFLHPFCDRLRSSQCRSKVRQSMQQEYNNSFEKQFGSLDREGNLKPPTSSSYSKVSSILGGNSIVGSSISIEMFHSITPRIQGNRSESSSRNRSQRASQLVVDVEDITDYRKSYHDTSSDSVRQFVIKSFWSLVVRPKALAIWDQQKVMSVVVNNSTTVNVDKLTLRGLTKQNKKDGWALDNLGQEDDDDDGEEEEEE